VTEPSRSRNRADGDLNGPVAVELTPADETLTDALSGYQQGDVLPTMPSIPIAGDDGMIGIWLTPNGTVVISQTCDVVQRSRLTVAVAPLVRLGGIQADEARAGKRPSLVHLPAINSGAFADLEVIATISKRWLVRHPRTAGVETDEDVRRFGRAVARKFGRFPFPDEVVPWLAPLAQVPGSKAAKPNTPEGKVLDEVVELRVEAAGGWTKPPYELVLAVLLKASALPLFDGDDLPDLPAGLGQWLYGDTEELSRGPAEIADRLVRSTDPPERYFLWQALGEAWATRCVPKGAQPKAVREAVNSVTSDVLGLDEYTLDRYRRSEQLDLDHLSPPLPE